MYYSGIDKASTADGTGVRVVLWCSGCNVHCEGCQNPETWDFEYGKKFNKDAYRELYDALNHDYISGLTLSGGHPLEYNNLPDIISIIDFVKEEFPDKTIWLYTGYALTIRDFDTIVDIGWDNGLLENYILSKCDVVVDGPFIQAERDVSIAFRGSRNQRLIDVKKTIENHEIVVLEE